jgi:phenylalanyl-tRNA synthetase beta subunit
MLGVVGEFHTKVAKSQKLPSFCAGFELDLDLLMEHIDPKKYETLSTYPDTLQDITFEIEPKVSWQHLEQLLHAELAVAKAESGYYYSIEPLDIFKKEDKANKRISFRIQLTHHSKTLKTEEVNKLLNQIAKAADENLGAKRI